MKSTFRISPVFTYVLVIPISLLMGQFFGGYVGILSMIVCASVLLLYHSYAWYKKGVTRWQLIGLVAFPPLMLITMGIVSFLMNL
jgi:hypothetical protein